MNVYKEYKEINYVLKWELGNKLYKKYVMAISVVAI